MKREDEKQTLIIYHGDELVHTCKIINQKLFDEIINEAERKGYLKVTRKEEGDKNE